MSRKSLAGRVGSSGRNWGGLIGTIALLVAAAWPAPSVAWDRTSSCAVETTESFQSDRSPQLYMMVDKSGSMRNPGGTFGAPGCIIYERDYLWTDVNRHVCTNCSSRSDCTSLGRQIYGRDFIDAVYQNPLENPDSQSKWSIAVETINDVTLSLQDDVQFGLGVFSDRSNTAPDGISGYSRASHKVMPGGLTHTTIAAALAQIGPGGGTYMSHGIGLSAEILDRASTPGHPQATVFLTDGQPTEAAETALQSACAHRRGTAGQAPLYVVGFGGGTDEAFNHALAAAGGTGYCCTTDECAATSPGRIADICDRDLSKYRDWTCRGAYQSDSKTALKRDLLAITQEFACTFDASSYWNKQWDDPSYECAGPEYDCLELLVPNDSIGGTRIWHRDAIGQPDRLRAWRWVDPSRQQQIVLNDTWCSRIKGFYRSEDRVVTVNRACICGGKTAGESCTNPSAGTCQCLDGTVQCRQSSFACQPDDPCGNRNDANLGVCTDTKTNSAGTCTANGPNLCQEDQLVCSATAPTPEPEGPGCDGIDNDCDGLIDEDFDPTATCAIPGESGRCAVGRLQCDGSCKSLHRSVPEICNGIDDDCNGIVDDIDASWRNNSSITLASLSPLERDRACGTVGACVCWPGQADTEVRGGISEGSRQAEFEAMVRQTETGCTCRE